MRIARFAAAAGLIFLSSLAIGWGWTILATYLIGFPIAWRRVAWVMLEDWKKDFSTIDSSDVLFVGFCALFPTVGWPLLWPGYAAYRKVKEINFDGGGLMIPPRSVRKQVEVEELQRRIRELEEDTGMTPKAPKERKLQRRF